MSEAAKTLDAVRDRIISDPALILEDRDLMKALIAANEKMLGSNIIDLRGIAMERLEERLDRLEDTHRSVIAAAYENLAGTNQIQRAVLALLEPADFASFVRALPDHVAGILRVERIRLVLESKASNVKSMKSLEKLGDTVMVVKSGTVDDYITTGRKIPVREVTLRQVTPSSPEFFGEAASWIQSEAVLRLDLGKGRLPGMLLLGSEDPHQFRASQGTEILGFLGGVFERLMRRWLA